jgi:hypothetical protein
MPLILADRVRETTTTTGTGTVTLAGAVSGFQSFSTVGNGNTTYYCIVDSATGAWETGLGTYSSTGPTLARTTVLESSNSNALVNFAAGSKDVFVTLPADKAVFTDSALALAYASSWFASSTSDFTVPDGVTRLRVYAVGKGGDAATFATERAPGGGGGGFAFGTIAVVPGSTVSATINSSSTTVSIGGTTHFTANAGSAPASASVGGVGGTASISGSVTSGNAYTGGTGGVTTANNQCGSGASAGSPLGAGVNGTTGSDVATYSTGPGGAGIGGGGNVGGGGGGAGSAAGVGSSSRQHGGSSGPAQLNSANLGANGAPRQFDQRFTEPLLRNVDGTGGYYTGTQAYISPGTGGGGSKMDGGNSGSAASAAYAGDFGGGGGASTTTTNANIRGMNGGILGGGGGAYRFGATTSGSTRGGDGGFGGGGGGACLAAAASGGTTTQGLGGGGCVVIFY